MRLDPANPELSEAMVRTLRFRLRETVGLLLGGNLAALAVVLVMVADQVPAWMSVTWAAGLLAVALARAGWSRYGSRDAVPARAVLAGTRLLALLHGLAWGAGVLLFAPRIPTAELALVLAALAGITGSVVHTVSADVPGFRLYLAGSLGPALWALLLHPRAPYHALMAALVVVFAAAMWHVHDHVHRALRAHLETALRLSASESAQTKLVAELREALARVRTLSGLLPVCAVCHKVRDDRGYWSSVERYVSEHTDARFSHGVCPECFPKLFPDIPPPDEVRGPGTGGPEPGGGPGAREPERETGGA